MCVHGGIWGENVSDKGSGGWPLDPGGKPDPEGPSGLKGVSPPTGRSKMPLSFKDANQRHGRPRREGNLEG